MLYEALLKTHKKVSNMHDWSAVLIPLTLRNLTTVTLKLPEMSQSKYNASIPRRNGRLNAGISDIVHGFSYNDNTKQTT